MGDEGDLMLAERVRSACVEAARLGYEDAAMSGLCGEGALEAAIGAIEKLDLRELLPAPHTALDKERSG